MTQQIINVGNVANDGTGSPLRTAFEYCNDNFEELYASVAGGTGIQNGTSNIAIEANGPIRMSVAGTSNVTTVLSSGLTVVGLNLTTGNISATGNIQGAFIKGDGSQLTGVVSSPLASAIIGNIMSANVTSSSLTQAGVLANLSASGNIIGGNLTTTGFLSASGNRTAQNLNTGGVVNAS